MKSLRVATHVTRQKTCCAMEGRLADRSNIGRSKRGDSGRLRASQEANCKGILIKALVTVSAVRLEAKVPRTKVQLTRNVMLLYVMLLHTSPLPAKCGNITQLWKRDCKNRGGGIRRSFCRVFSKLRNSKGKPPIGKHC